MNKARVFTTFRGEDNVTYQIMAYRELRSDEVLKKVTDYLKKAARQNPPKPGDVVIMETAIGLR